MHLFNKCIKGDINYCKTELKENGKLWYKISFNFILFSLYININETISSLTFSIVFIIMFKVSSFYIWNILENMHKIN